jgi:hypothetical protein
LNDVLDKVIEAFVDIERGFPLKALGDAVRTEPVILAGILATLRA